MKTITRAFVLPGSAASLCAFLTVLASASQTRAEEPYVTWAKSSAWGFDVYGGFALTSKGETLVSTGDARLLKFDALGRLASSNQVSSLPGRMTLINGITTDRSGATFLAGLGGVDSNAFSVVKWNAGGELVWASRESAPLSTYPYNAAVAITSDALGNLWVSALATVVDQCSASWIRTGRFFSLGASNIKPLERPPALNVMTWWSTCRAMS